MLFDQLVNNNIELKCTHQPELLGFKCQHGTIDKWRFKEMQASETTTPAKSKKS